MAADDADTLPPMMTLQQLKEHCICPITLEMMVDPVEAADNHTYERQAIARVIAEQGAQARSPLTQQPLADHRLRPNMALRSLMAAAFVDHVLAPCPAPVPSAATGASGRTGPGPAVGPDAALQPPMLQQMRAPMPEHPRDVMHVLVALRRTIQRCQDQIARQLRRLDDCQLTVGFRPPPLPRFSPERNDCGACGWHSNDLTWGEVCCCLSWAGSDLCQRASALVDQGRRWPAAGCCFLGTLVGAVALPVMALPFALDAAVLCSVFLKTSNAACQRRQISWQPSAWRRGRVQRQCDHLLGQWSQALMNAPDLLYQVNADSGALELSAAASAHPEGFLALLGGFERWCMQQPIFSGQRLEAVRRHLAPLQARMQGSALPLWPGGGGHFVQAPAVAAPAGLLAPG